MIKPTTALLLALWVGTPGATRDAEITVFAAASLTNVLQELGAAYEAQGGEPVVFNFAASSTLARQIDEGAPADVFVSADEAKMDGLERRGALVEGTRRGLLANTLVVVVPDDSDLALAGPQDLAGAAVRVLALAEPQSVPAGIYAKEYLQRAGVWRQVVDNVVPTENVRAALAAVESGNADAAIVYKTDALASGRVRVAYEVGAGEAPQIAYPLAVVKGGRNVEGGKAFAAYLESAPARAAFRRHGFLVPRSLAVP
jgi:molybdate transport system substrate-binding protein